MLMLHGGGSFRIGSSSSSLESDALVTNGNTDEPILHAADVNNEEDVEIVMVC